MTENPAKARSRLGLAALLGISSQLLTLGVGLWATPRLLSGLGDAAYGVLAIVVSFATYFAYLELGLGAAYLRELSAALSRGDAGRAQRLAETAHAIYLLVGLLGTALMLGVGVPYLGAAISDEALRAEARLCLLITAALLASSMALSASRGVVFAAQRTDLFMRVTLVLQPTIPLVQVATIGLGGGLVWVIAVQAAGGLSVDLLMLAYARRLAPDLRFRPRLSRELWRELRGFSLYKFISQLSQQGQLTGDRLLLGYLLPDVSALAPYTLGASIAQRVRALAGSATAGFFPAAAERYAQDGEAGLGALVLAFGRRVAVFLALCCAGASYLAYPFLVAWVGPGYAGEGAAALAILIVATSLLTLSVLSGQATDAAGRPRASAIAAGLGLLASVAVSAPLVLWLGAIGAAWGFLAGSALQFFLSAAALAALLGRAARRLLFDCLAGPILLGGAAYALMRLLPEGESFFGHLPAAAAGGLGGLLVGLALGLVRREDLPARLRGRAEGRRPE